MLTVQNIVNVNQEIHFSYRALKARALNDIQRNWLPSFKLIRNLADDTFRLEIINGFDESNWRPTHKPYINIDKKLILNDEVEYPTATINDDGHKVFKISSGTLNKTKLSDVHQMIVGLAHNGIPSIMFEITFRQNTMDSNQANLTGNKYLRFKFLKELEFFATSLQSDRETLYQPFDVGTRQKYSSTYFVPKPITRLSYTEDVMDIYSDEFYIEEAVDDNIFQPGVRTSSALEKGLHTRLNYNIDHNSVIAIQDGHIRKNVHKVGTISIIDQSYYDYKKGRTVAGVDSTSRVGEIIPYNFKGTYIWQQNISGYGMLKDFQISSTQKFNIPLLNLSEGAVQLHLNDTYRNHLASRYEITGEDIEQLKEIENPSMVTLRRLSSEEVS